MEASAPPASTKKFHVPERPLKIVLFVAVCIAFLYLYQQNGQPVTLTINSTPYTVRTHRLSVESVLAQIGLQLNPHDALWPPLESGLTPNQTIEIKLARPIQLDSGSGHSQIIDTHYHTPQEILAEQGIALAEADDIFVGDSPWNPEQAIPVNLPHLPPTAISLKAKIQAQRPLPVKLRLQKAIPIQIDDNGKISTLNTTLKTVGDVLLAQNIPLYLGDSISPDLSASLTPNTAIVIKRAIPVSVMVDGRQIKTRTQKQTVGDVLAQEQVILAGQDYTIPAEDQPLTPDTNIEVVRVLEALEISQETTDFETIWVPDPNLELDVQEIQQKGQQGVTKSRTRVRYENGVETARNLEETWLEYEPADKVIAYGTKVVIRTLDTPDGPIEYWRKIRMLATGYSAATSGKDKDHPAYGITRSGMIAGYGIVAVDPGVIPLLTNVYVPGYGKAIAGDTGGAILGKRIDLGFDEDAPPPWYKWTEVYVLTPAPPWHEIRYVLPQWPQE